MRKITTKPKRALDTNAKVEMQGQLKVHENPTYNRARRKTKSVEDTNVKRMDGVSSK